MHPSRVIALAAGVLYTVFGVAGFLVTGIDDVVGVTGRTLLGFEINPLHNVVHLGVGLLGVAMSAPVTAARSFGWLLAGVYGLAVLYGLVAVGDPAVNFLSLNIADNWLHAVSALVGVTAALWPARDPAIA